jgi:hypothetical protein
MATLTYKGVLDAGKRVIEMSKIMLDKKEEWLTSIGFDINEFNQILQNLEYGDRGKIENYLSELFQHSGQTGTWHPAHLIAYSSTYLAYHNSRTRVEILQKEKGRRNKTLDLKSASDDFDLFGKLLYVTYRLENKLIQYHILELVRELKQLSGMNYIEQLEEDIDFSPITKKYPELRSKNPDELFKMLQEVKEKWTNVNIDNAS